MLTVMPDGESLQRLAQVMGFCVFVVVCVRLRPWRFLSRLVRRG